MAIRTSCFLFGYGATLAAPYVAPPMVGATDVACVLLALGVIAFVVTHAVMKRGGP